MNLQRFSFRHDRLAIYRYLQSLADTSQSRQVARRQNERGERLPGT